MSQNNFMIGPMEDISNGDSEGEILGDKWQVNCLNMWVATLGTTLTFENSILGHQIILLHELTHTCTDEPHDSWDWFLWESILGGKIKDIWYWS
jgi:hypothetical protein